ncbi:putative RNA polymerase ECF-type sigma factor [Pedobacter sp. BAL39]|uniref:RNA polymerase sigma factor n=1 Tax=Pedobacter sp. BAL39 TaxID=391596 RepID=UPI0001559B10|nr:RNA polymerase sigma-70 factor [Pedobacter sp. BAL39]EDM36271.1 putative RNA polymerase ECF-type sigma factor [Pedobacter sp. BAL39]
MIRRPSTYAKHTDQKLAALLQQGDEYAYTEIFERYKVLLYKHAYRLLGDEDEANDIISDLFLALWQKRESLNLQVSLSSYLYGSIRNRVFDLMTHQKVIVRYLDSIQEFIAQGHYETDERIRAKELAAIIEREIAALPPKMRQVFEFSRMGDLSYKEIGEMLDITEGTVKQQVHNAVKTLRLKIHSFMVLFSLL